VPSRFPNTTSARSCERIPFRYVAGDGGSVGVDPSMVSPTATIVSLRFGRGGAVADADVAVLESPRTESVAPAGEPAAERARVSCPVRPPAR
jgi:hypothetical protein